MPTSLEKAKLKRGDSYAFQVTITDGTFGATDILEWQARKKITDESPAIAKSSVSGGVVRLSATTAEVKLLPSDTVNFDKQTVLYWEFQRKSLDGLTVDTLILPSGKTYGELTVELDYLRP
jgi:hypothetical protein